MITICLHSPSSSVVEQKPEELCVAGSIPALGSLDWSFMAKKKDLGMAALIGGSGYFSPRKLSSGVYKTGFKLRKYDPLLRKHVVASSVVNSKRIKAK